MATRVYDREREEQIPLAESPSELGDRFDRGVRLHLGSFVALVELLIENPSPAMRELAQTKVDEYQVWWADMQERLAATHAATVLRSVH